MMKVSWLNSKASEASAYQLSDGKWLLEDLFLHCSMRVTSFVLGNFVVTREVEEGDETLKNWGNSATAGNGEQLPRGQYSLWEAKGSIKFDAGCASLP